MIKREISVVSFKHNGKFHRSWESFNLLEENDEFIILGNYTSKIIETDGRIWYSREPGIFIFSKKEFYNVVCMLKKQGVRYYVNLASPAYFKDDVVYYIDYDLDITFSLDKEVKLLDEDEFQSNSISFGYSEKLIKVILQQKDIIIQKIANLEFPFAEKTINKYKELIKI